MLLLSILAACTPAFLDTDSPEDTGIESLPVEVVLSAEALPKSLPLGVVDVSWSPSEPGLSWVEFGLDTSDQRTPGTRQDKTWHTVPMVGLKAGRTYTWQAFTLTDSGHLLASELSQVEVPPPPRQLATHTLTVQADDAPSGYILTSQIVQGSSWMLILDTDGDLVWGWPAAAATTILAVDVHDDRVVYNQQAQVFNMDKGEVVDVPLDGCSEPGHTRVHNGHHAFTFLPDGKVATLSLVQQQMDVEGEDWVVSAEQIIEVPLHNPDPAEYDVVFDFFEDYPGEPTLELLDYPMFVDTLYWSHANSLAFLPNPVGYKPHMTSGDQGDYFLGVRHLDTVLRIDGGTGQVLWQLGGADSDFDLSEEDQPRQGHFSQLWDGGMIYFDNRDMGEASRVVEYAWDEGERTAEVVWSYEHPHGSHVAFLGDARRLPDGHTLVSWTSLGTLEVVSLDHEVVWQAQLDVGAAWGRAMWVPDIFAPFRE